MGAVYQISWKKMGMGEKVYQNLCVILLRVNMAIDSSAQAKYGGLIKYCHNNK
jgi:hypothetical protein